MEDRNLQKQRVLVMYPPSTPCDDLVEWVIDKVTANAFEVVRPPLQIRKCKEFRQISQSVEGIIALCIPFHKDHPQQTSAWIHNWIGAIAAQADPRIPILVIMAEGVDVGGLAKLDDCRCPVVYHWQAEQTEKKQRSAENSSISDTPF